MRPAGVSRRRFLEQVAAGVAGAAGMFAGVYAYAEFAGIRYVPPRPRQPWEVDFGVVDYAAVRESQYGPRELGFERDIRQSPPDARVLDVAQWYDYWPGQVVHDFTTWMEQKWGVSGVSVRWTSNIYTSNEELFSWVSRGRTLDVMFPTNHTVERLEKAGDIVNLNRDWIPNYVNIFGRVPAEFPFVFQTTRPEFYKSTYPGLDDEYGNGYNNHVAADFRDLALNGYAYRGNMETYPSQKPHPRNDTWTEADGLLAVPYQWGTTGIGFRTDIFRRQDIENLGWKAFELATYTNTETGRTYDLTKKKMMLDDMRETFTAALKAVGWKRQEEAGIPPTATPLKPEAPYNGEYQWSNNEVANEKLSAALAWLNSFRGGSWGFNTPQQGPWLVSGQIYVDQAWSGDIMYAVQPNSNTFNSVDYFVPKQGGARWIDNSVIHRECEKLWLAHELINYIHDPIVQAAISSWNLYATPNAWTFELLYRDPAYIFEGIYPDGRRYEYNMAEDERIYGDIAYDDDVQDAPYDGPPILTRCEYQKDVGVRNTLNYFRYWRKAKF